MFSDAVTGERVSGTTCSSTNDCETKCNNDNTCLGYSGPPRSTPCSDPSKTTEYACLYKEVRSGPPLNPGDANYLNETECGDLATLLGYSFSPSDVYSTIKTNGCMAYEMPAPHGLQHTVRFNRKPTSASTADCGTDDNEYVCFTKSGNTWVDIDWQYGSTLSADSSAVAYYKGFGKTDPSKIVTTDAQGKVTFSHNVEIDGDLDVPDGQLFLNGQPVTVSSSEINDLALIKDINATIAEINTLDTVVATPAKLNIMHGVTANATDLNRLDIAAVGQSEANKVITATSTHGYVTLNGDVDVSVLEVNGCLDDNTKTEATCGTCSDTTQDNVNDCDESFCVEDPTKSTQITCGSCNDALKNDEVDCTGQYCVNNPSYELASCGTCND